MEAKDGFSEGMKVPIPADVFRAALYNNMLKQLDVALGKWLVNLSPSQRKDLFDALDWHHTGKLNAIKRDRKAVFTDLPDGKWPTTEMTVESAKAKFEKLQSIKWLKLKPCEEKTWP